MVGISRSTETAVCSSSRVMLVLLACAAALPTAAWGKVAVTWDFTKGLQGWQGNGHVADLSVSAEGLAFRSTGNDPWIEGPAVDLPGAGLTRVRVRMSSDADAHGELFYGRVFEAGRSVQFTIQNDGQWHEYLLLIREPLGRATRFRLDPTGSEGYIRVGSIEVQTLPVVPPPQFERPERPVAGTAQPALVNRDELTLEHYQGGWGDFVIKVDGREMAAGYSAERIGVVLDEKTQWLNLREANLTYMFTRNGGRCEATLKDSGNGQWRVTRVFKAGEWPGTISVETAVTVDKDRRVAYLPWLTLFPGLGTFGERKTQGLFAGLEYLSDEPSSSEADITTPEHIRRVPDRVKITFPLVAIAHEDHYIGLIWEPSEMVAAVFDSPDGVYGSGAHVMALTAPAVGASRFENDLAAHTPLTLKANQPLTVRALIIGGTGRTVVPAIQKYVDIREVPHVSRFEGGFDAAVTLLAHGWLDSAINEGGLFRHAVWGESFGAGPAGDAPMYIDWLAHHVQDAGLADRLGKGRDLAVSKMPRGQPYASAVSHTRTPTAPFVFGGVYPYVEQRQAEAQGLVKHFDEQGIKRYRPGTVDYSKTHFAKHANGYAAGDVVRILEAATMSADPELIREGLALLDQQTALYADSVPRGAQTWEVPLHTPDILASAYLVKAYTLGYIISGREEHLEQARYWAWTGVPFVYLINPTDGEVGPYATIAVLGATNWQAPSWFGRPVQWCGLVYCSALHLLSEYDREGPWQTIAKGITATGLQMTWPATDGKRQGLLPDIFELRAQISDGPAINPGTVQAHVPELFDKGVLYDVRRLAAKGWFIHAPCAIRDIHETPDSVTFVVDGWDRKVFYVLLSGVAKEPAGVTVRPTATDASRQVAESRANSDFSPRQQLLAITLSEPSAIRIQF